MNFKNIINEIAQADPEFFEKTSERRNVIRKWGKGMALAAVPTAVGALFNKAYGKTTDAISDVLQFALLLEQLEAEFYANALAVTSPFILIPNGGARTAIMVIAEHEKEHVKFLEGVLTATGVTPNPKPAFDFTAGGMFGNVFSNYETFLAVAQVFEDTGVRAYKGQAGNLISNNTILTAALRIHSVEARHAAHIRKMRRDNNFSDVKPWITGAETGVNGVNVGASYFGEDNNLQLNIRIEGITDMPAPISFAAATEAFDEPLSALQVMDIVKPFLVV